MSAFMVVCEEQFFLRNRELTPLIHIISLSRAPINRAENLITLHFHHADSIPYSKQQTRSRNKHILQ